MRLGLGNVLFWLALVGHTYAAVGPVIRPATIELGTTGTVRFQFEAGAGEPGEFQVESAIGLGGAAGWEVHAQVPMTELMPGLYEVSIPWRGDGPASFYRVVAWGSTSTSVMAADNSGAAFRSRLAWAEPRSRSTKSPASCCSVSFMNPASNTFRPRAARSAKIAEPLRPASGRKA